MRAPARVFISLILVAIVVASCAIVEKAKGQKQESAGPRNSESPFALAEIPANLLPTLVVGVDSCYVFLKPANNSDFFGPLLKDEKIKRLDAEAGWVRVWIPRLRVAGWVHQDKVSVTDEETSNHGSVSTKLLTRVRIPKTTVNVRKTPSVRAPIIFKARRHQAFWLLDERDGWYQIWIPQLQGKGWVAERVVSR